MDDLAAPPCGNAADLRRRGCRAIWAVLLLIVLSSGCLSVDRNVGCAGDGCLSGSAHVEVLRGITGYWPGADRFQEQLASRGLSSTVSWCELYPRVADRLIERKRLNPHLPIVVVGYSLGANNALKLSRRLQEAGVAVDALVLLETTYDDTVPANVRRCFNAYKPRPLDQIPFMRGIPLGTDSRSTVMTNYDFRHHDDGRYHGLNHLTLCNDDNVQSLLADAVAVSFVPNDGGSGTAVVGRAAISDGWYDVPSTSEFAPAATTIEPSFD